jgi:hypothetical protein
MWGSMASVDSPPSLRTVLSLYEQFSTLRAFKALARQHFSKSERLALTATSPLERSCLSIVNEAIRGNS